MSDVYAEQPERVLAEQRPAVRSQSQQRLLDSLDGLCSRALVEAYLRDMADTIARSAARSPSYSNWIRQYGPEPVAAAIEKAAGARAFWLPTISPIFCASNNPHDARTSYYYSYDARLNARVTEPVSLLGDAFILEAGKESDDSLEQKLQQLNLSVMTRNLETTIAEAAAKNLSVAATLEWLADMELEARQHRAIERRFKCARLQVQTQHWTGSRLPPSQSRVQFLKTASCGCSILPFLWGTAPISC